MVKKQHKFMKLLLVLKFTISAFTFQYLVALKIEYGRTNSDPYSEYLIEKL